MAKNKKSGNTSNKGEIYRNAETGKFVSKQYAQKHPKTTIKETISRGASGATKRPGTRTGGPKKA
jgi:hypothetical protein